VADGDTGGTSYQPRPLRRIAGREQTVRELSSRRGIQITSPPVPSASSRPTPSKWPVRSGRAGIGRQAVDPRPARYGGLRHLAAVEDAAAIRLADRSSGGVEAVLTRNSSPAQGGRRGRAGASASSSSWTGFLSARAGAGIGNHGDLRGQLRSPRPSGRRMNRVLHQRCRGPGRWSARLAAVGERRVLQDRGYRSPPSNGGKVRSDVAALGRLSVVRRRPRRPFTIRRRPGQALHHDGRCGLLNREQARAGITLLSGYISLRSDRFPGPISRRSSAGDAPGRQGLHLQASLSGATFPQASQPPSAGLLRSLRLYRECRRGDQ
jgi:hypothetical protein